MNQSEEHPKKLNSIIFLFILLFTSLPFLSVLPAPQSYTVDSVPNPRTSHGGFVTDPDSILGEEGAVINDLLIKFEKDTGNEIAVVVLPSIGEQVPKDFAVELFNTWGIGKKGKDNGLLLLMVVDQRRWEFETGYGLEGILPDVLLHRIGQDEMLPHFKKKNFGKGVLAGINAVIQKLNDGVEYSATDEAAQNSENSAASNMKEHFDLGLYVFAGIFTFAYLFTMTAQIFRTPALKKKKNNEEDAPIILPQSRFYYLVKVILWPVIAWSLILFGYNFFNIFITYIVMNALLPLERIRRNFLLGKFAEDAYTRYKILTKDHGVLFYVFLFLFPLGMAPMFLYYRFKRRALRNEPRNCPSCKTPLTLLDENADDAFLTEGKRMEEYVKSIDYDVWLCSSCNHVDIYPYEAVFTSYSRCSSCKHKTYHTISSRTLVSPTCSSSGKGERTNKCEFCKVQNTETYTIPRRDCSKSSSGGGGSSGGGSSFGGGSSGGGGSGGSW